MRKTMAWLLVLQLSLGLSAMADGTQGQVDGPDRDNPGCYVIHMPSDLKIERRDIVRVERSGTLVTEASIAQVQVDRLTIRPKDARAAIKAGDTVVYVGAPPPVTGVGTTGAAPGRPAQRQPGLHVSVTPASTFTDDNGYWAATVFVSNDGDVAASCKVGGVFKTPTGDEDSKMDQWFDVAPGEMKTLTFTSRFKSAFGRHNAVSNTSGVTSSSNWSVSGGQVDGITGVTFDINQRIDKKPGK